MSARTRMYLFRYWHGLLPIQLVGSGKEDIIAMAAYGGQSRVLRCLPYWEGPTVVRMASGGAGPLSTTNQGVGSSISSKTFGIK